MDAEPVGRFHTWWRGDTMSALPEVPELVVAPAGDERLVAELTGVPAGEIARRVERGHQPWLARLAGQPVGWGWSAARELSIGELGLWREVPPGNRYLWDFCTAPPWRGRGIYPRMLQAIVARETGVERFWLGHDMGNVASARGIAKAGFREVGILYREPDGGFVLVPSGPRSVAETAATLFGVAVMNEHGDCRVRSIADENRTAFVR